MAQPWQQVAVIGNLNHLRSVREAVLEEAGNGGIQDAKAVSAAFHFKEWLVDQVHRHHIAKKAVEIEDVKDKLTILIESLVSQHEVNVIIQVAEVVCRSAGQLKVNAIADAFITAIQAAIDVEHGSVAFVYVL